MKITQFSLVFCLTMLFQLNGNAQLQKVIVEKYYISDANDATDTLGGGLSAGSTTYRIYVDLVPGSILKKNLRGCESSLFDSKYVTVF